jgi:hypothetical protein
LGGRRRAAAASRNDMTTGIIDTRLKLHSIFWYCVVGVSALVFGYFLAADLLTIALMISSVTWLLLLPYHAQLAFKLAVGTFGSALILAFLPGRPYFWEFAAVLAWSGVVMTLVMRTQAPEFKQTVRENRWMYVGMAGYVVVLIVTMLHTGFGLRILGSEQVGGRFYFQQLVCAIFPLLFAMVRVEESTLLRLIKWQWLLSATYVVSDFVFSIAPDQFWVIRYFLELASDAWNFEVQNLQFGIRRFQSLAFFGQGFIFFLLIFYSLRDFFRFRAVWLLPVALGTVAMSLLSGHRWVVAILCFTLFFCGYAQRFFTWPNLAFAAGVLLVILSFVYACSDRLPLAFQRSVSFLPGVRIQNVTRIDADNTLQLRRRMFVVGLDLIPQYLWMGRGFARYMDDWGASYDPTTITAHIHQGKYYNGFIGLMINTGLFGTFFMLLFVLAGCRVAWRIMLHLRRYGCEDNFSRVCSVVAANWMANVLAFLFLHGDSEYAMRTFSLQAGILLVCRGLLQQRFRDERPLHRVSLAG